MERIELVKTAQTHGTCFRCGKRTWHDATLTLTFTQDLTEIYDLWTRCRRLEKKIEVQLVAKCLTCGRVSKSKEPTVTVCDYEPEESQNAANSWVTIYPKWIDTAYRSSFGSKSLAYALEVAWLTGPEITKSVQLSSGEHYLVASMHAVEGQVL